MSDRKKAFAAMEVYREIMYSDASPETMVQGLSALADALEHLEMDKDVVVMVQGLFDQTSMRIQLIGDREERRAAAAAAEVADKAEHTVRYLHNWSKSFLKSMCERFDEVNYNDVRAAIARQAERNAWYEVDTNVLK